MLKRLEIKGFRGLSKTIEFDRATLITAGNGLGKTTILDAIRWCLVGVDGEDKTNNNVFNNRKVEDGTKETVSVRCTLSDQDGVETIFGRTASRKGDKVDYGYLYGEVEVAAKKYADLLEKALLPLTHLKFVLNIRRWDNLDDGILRSALLNLYDGSDIICTPAFAPIRNEIEVSGLADTKKRIRKDLKTLKGSLDTLEVELNMVKQSMPEILELGDLHKRLEEREAELKRFESTPSEIPVELSEKLQSEAVIIASLEAEYETARNQHHIDYTMRLQEMRATYEQSKNDKRLVERLKAEIECEQAVVENGKKKMEDLRAEYDMVVKRVFEGACPCCGRPYEGVKREELQAEHLQKKDEAIAKLKAQAKRVKDNVAAAEQNIVNCNTRLEQINSCDLNAMLNEIKKMESEGERSFATSEKAMALQEKIDKAKAERTDVSNYDKERVNMITSLRDEIFALKMQFNETERLSKEREDCEIKVADISARRANIVKQHSELEGTLALANRYETTLLQGLQDYLNEMMGAESDSEGEAMISLYYVDELGDVCPQCKIISNGVATTINNAQRNIIGLRLAEALIRKSGKDIPVLIDNAEAFDKEHIPTSDYQLIVAKVDDEGGMMKISAIKAQKDEE